MSRDKAKKATGYDKYVDWKFFIIPVVLLFAILIMPTPNGMKDVGDGSIPGRPQAADYSFCHQKTISIETSSQADQWQLLTGHASWSRIPADGRAQSQAVF